jgi:hypothetical protein
MSMVPGTVGTCALTSGNAGGGSPGKAVLSQMPEPRPRHVHRSAHLRALLRV